jgi:hypothetical protein
MKIIFCFYLLLLPLTLYAKVEYCQSTYESHLGQYQSSWRDELKDLNYGRQNGVYSEAEYLVGIQDLEEQKSRVKEEEAQLREDCILKHK